ncbi:serine/threonine-protein kinase [Streptomyces sp. NPDC006368]|uniref:serine/threonine-protein kinase n=1 Tax=Streptomyces sp. NPDC006368 TaxID=3156760 RepID=UPI0033AD5DF5
MKVRPWSIRPDLRLTAHVVAGRYRLDDLLGRGGAADVYEGLDLRLRRPVAVKVFRPEGEAQAEERFTDEGRLLAQLQHPGLVTVYDSGQEDGRPYLVMQLIKGTTLRRRIAVAPMTPVEVCRIGSALASALAHVHAAGVVHRDVKPSNILLDETGAPHLTDFGISRLLDTTTHTATGTLVGTAAYMAPEQVLGKGAGPAADIYSLGLVLLEALKGELEYGGGAPLEAAIARLHRPPVIPSDLPGDLVELLEAMTDPDENNRPDAHACLRALSVVPGGHPAPSSFEVGRRGDDRDPAGDTLRSEVSSARTGGVAGPVVAATRSDGHAAPKPPFPALASFRAGRALLTAGAALAVFGTTLTGSIDGRPAEAEDAASRPPRQTATEPPSAPAGHPGPSSSSPAVPASHPDPLRRSPTAAAEEPTPEEATGKTSPAVGERAAPGPAPAPAPAASRGEHGSSQGNAVGGGPGRKKTDVPPMKAKPPKNNHKK